MATEDLQTFLENRLTAMDPSIDLSPGSPAQTQFITPVLNKLGTDPFETDIDSFILDRFTQEFPDIYAGDPSAVRDMFIKPMILLLEPFKRETANIAINQSVQDPTVLSDEDADAIAANFFIDRTGGAKATGVERVYFSNPTNVDIQTTTRFYTASALNFFPIEPTSIAAEEMVYNRSGSLYFVDVTVMAENEGDSYNVDKDEISGVDSIYGAVKVSNLRKFTDGTSQVDTATFISNIKETLTERSLVTRRGAKARLNEVFQGKTRAIQVIGAGDPEMLRDILVAAAPGHSWLTGTVSFYGNTALVQCKIVDGITSDAPVVGDTLYAYLDPYSNSARWAGLSQSSRLATLTITQVLVGPMNASSPYQVAYLVIWSGSLPAGATLLPTGVTIVEGGFRRKGTIRISSLADIGPTSLTVNNQAVHVYGHSDIYLRPVIQDTSKAVLSGLYDTPSFLELQGLTTTASSNVVSTTAIDYVVSGVSPGDELVIETGNDAGLYTILSLDSGSPSNLHLSAKLTTTASSSSIRYRVQKKIRIDPFEPKILRLPFGNTVCNDLSTVIGGATITLSSNDLITYGAKIGDVVRTTSGIAPNDYTITGFDPVLGGRGPLVTPAPGSTEAGLTYIVFTPLDKVLTPLVRIKDMLLLDSAKQSIGISIPPADPVAIIPTCDFNSARVRGSSVANTGYVLPDITSYVSGGNVAGTLSGRRYSLGIDTSTGTYKSFVCIDSSTTNIEVDTRLDTSGSCSWFVAPIEVLSSLIDSVPSITPKIGECLAIKNGPNQGSYLIKNVVKVRYPNANNLHSTTYFIQIYGKFPTDVMRNIITFLDTASVASGNTALAVPKLSGTGTFSIAYLQNTYNNFATQLDAAFTYYGMTSPGVSSIQSALDGVSKVYYEWGDAAKGTLRTYFRLPTLFELNTANNSTLSSFTYTNATGSTVNFLPDPFKYTGYQLDPPTLQDVLPDPSTFYRDFDASTTSSPNFTDTTKTNVFLLGVSPGDNFQWYPALFPTTGSFSGKYATIGVMTSAGSPIITLLPSTGGVFSASLVGSLLFIDDSTDGGMYRVIKYIDNYNLVVDRPLTTTTPTILNDGTSTVWGSPSAGVNVIQSVASNLTAYNGKYITFYGGNAAQYSGSYLITGTSYGSNVNAVTISKAGGDFPTYSVGTTTYYAITNAPTSSLITVFSGTQFAGLRTVRMYNSVPSVLPILSIVNDLSLSKITLDVSSGLHPIDNTMMPYSIVRPNIRRVTPTELNGNAENSLFYVDTEVLSTSPEPSANVLEGSYLTILQGTYRSQGYRHIVADKTLTYSVNEAGKVDILSTSLLPIGVADSIQNYINLVGTPTQVSYEQATIVADFQDFLDSPEDRVTAANLMARHFLPSYVSYSASYVGGSAPSIIAKDISSYIDQLGVENPIDVSVIESKISGRGGNVITPTTITTLTHDWSRNAWAEFNENQIGGLVTDVPLDGTARISYYVPGPDTSGQSPQPTGEQINLTRE